MVVAQRRSVHFGIGYMVFFLCVEFFWVERKEGGNGFGCLFGSTGTSGACTSRETSQ